MVVGAVSGLAAPASAAFSAAGPVDPATGFPAYYTDSNGLSLELCLGVPLCLSDTDLVAIHEAGGDAEAFYYAADATAGPFELHLALEAAYAGDGPDQEQVFQRTQVRAPATGSLVAGATYRVTDPYGTYTCTARADGTIGSNGCRIESTPVPLEFNRALPGRLGPFLTQDPTEPAPPAGYIGDNATEVKVVGSPTGFNGFRVTGPGLSGTCGANCVETDGFILQGKIADTGVPSASISAGTLDFGDVPATPAVTKTLTYANTGGVPVEIGPVTLGGANPSAFAVDNNCPASVAVGADCTIGVTFTPQSGQSSTATLTIADNTPAATRTVTLKGSNLGVMTASPAGVTFPDQAVNTTSAVDNVVVGNSGNGPLTVTSAEIVGTGATHFLIPAGGNGCTTAVAPDGGCEVSVAFRPTTTGLKQATLRLTDSNGNVKNVALSGTGVSAPPPPPENPTAPTLSGSLTGTTASLDWTAGTDNVGVTRYRVLRNGTQVALQAGRTFSQANLAPGTYNYTVTALDAAGNESVESNTVTLTVPSANTPPTVTAKAPLPGATSVGVAANVSATFSEVVQGVTAGTFQIKDPAGVVVDAALTNPTARRWLLNPTRNLAANTTYTVTLTGGSTAIRDSAGAALASTSWSFTTAAATNVAPTVKGRTPAVGAVGVARGINISATFSEAVTGVSQTTFALRLASATSTSTPITATVTNVAGTNRWILNPSARLLANRQYRVTLTGGSNAIRDLAGAPLAGSPVTWTFTTGA